MNKVGVDVTDHLRALSEQGVVRWSPELVRSRVLAGSRIPVESWAVPSLAHKHLPGARPATTGTCPLCAATADPVLALTPDAWRSPSVPPLDLVANTMPFFSDQSMVVTPDHRPGFTDAEWVRLVRLPAEVGLPYLASQQAGSGATLPGHAHVALSTQRVPLLDLPRTVRAWGRGVEIGVLDGFPGLAVVVGEAEERSSRGLVRVLRALERRAMPCNVYTGHADGVVVVPRPRERDRTGRRAGSPEIGGVLLSNADGYAGTDLQGLMDHMVRMAEVATARDFHVLVGDTTLPPDTRLDTLLPVAEVLR